MATNTLQTDQWEFELGEAPSASFLTLQTDQWNFVLGTPVTPLTLQTNLWTFSATGEVGVLPDYNTSLISCLTRVQQNLGFPQFIMGGRGGASGTDYALFKKADTYNRAVWRSEVYKIGRDFDVSRIRFNLVTDFAPGTSITPKLYFDNERSSAVGTVINTNNYTSKHIELLPSNFSGAVRGQHSFFLEFQFTGTALAVISLPLFIEVDIIDT